MPIYEYRCSGCDTIFEELVSAAESETASPACPECGAASERVLSQCRPITQAATGGYTANSVRSPSCPKMNGGTGGCSSCG